MSANALADSYLKEFLGSWDRQTQMLLGLAGLVTEENRRTKSSPDSFEADMHLCHVHESRYWWLGKVSPKHQATLGDVVRQEGEDWVPIDDLDEIRRQLSVSGVAVRDAVEEAMADGGGAVGPYSHPFHFMQHMLWHEGYHFALVHLALRNAGCEPTEEWEEQNVWGIWRS